jgi:hypothetical protein
MSELTPWFAGQVTRAQAFTEMQNPAFRKNYADLFPHGLYLNSGLYGQQRGYSMSIQSYKAPGIRDLWGLLGKTAIWDVRVDPVYPTMWVSPHSRIFVIRDMLTDWGSIPTVLKWRFDPCECLWFLFHDEGYASHGLWEVVSAQGEDRFCKLSRAWLDDGLYEGYLCQWRMWNSLSRAHQIWAGVRLGGSLPWKNHGTVRQAIQTGAKRLP